MLYKESTRDAHYVAAQPIAPAAWPPAKGVVTFHNEMQDLLAPQGIQIAAPPQQPQTAPASEPHETAPDRGVISEVTPENAAGTSRAQRAAPNHATSRARRDSRRHARERD